MSEVIFITTGDARYGFSLAGSQQLIITPAEAETQVIASMADKDVGVLVLDERLVQAIGEKRLAELEAGWQGMLVTLPAPEAGGEEDALQRMIRRALGYHVRLQL